jgi:hypothetical protein
MQILVCHLEKCRLGLVLKVGPEQLQQRIVSGMCRGKPDLELFGDGGEASVCASSITRLPTSIEGVGPAVFVTPDNYLIRQVVSDRLRGKD